MGLPESGASVLTLLVGGGLAALVLWLAWYRPALILMLALASLGIPPGLLWGGSGVHYGWGLQHTLFLSALIVHAIRFGVRASINWPVLALATLAGLSVALGDLHRDVDGGLVLMTLMLLALPFGFTQVIIPADLRRTCGQVIMVTPLLSVALGLALHVAGALPALTGIDGGLAWTLGDADVFAALAFVGFAVALHESTRHGRSWIAALVGINLVLVVLSGSRAAVLASAALLLVYVLVSERFRERGRQAPIAIVLGVCVVGAALIIYMPIFLDSLWGEGSARSEPVSRVELWRFFYEEFMRSPLFGRGPGVGFVAGGEFAALSLPHSEYLHLLVTGGIVGAAMVLAGILLWYRGLLQAASGNDRAFLLAVAGAGAIYAFADNFLIYPGALALFAYVGILHSRHRRSEGGVLQARHSRSERRHSALSKNAPEHGHALAAPAHGGAGAPAPAERRPTTGPWLRALKHRRSRSHDRPRSRTARTAAPWYRRALDLVPSVGLATYFVLKIFYVYPSGKPQPADFFLVVVMAVSLIVLWRKLPREPALYLSLGLFVGWVAVVNGTWFLLLDETGFVRSTLFYAYNAMILLFVIFAAAHDFARLQKFTMLACLLAITIQFIDVTVVGEMAYGSRTLGTFNDPNQLGYWALLAVACYAVIRGDKGGNLLDLAVLLAGFYIVYTGLSRSATTAMLVLGALVVWHTRWEHRGQILGAGALILAASAVGTALFEPLRGLSKRLMNIDVGEVGERGYERITEHPQYLIFGAGESAHWRFHERAIELHSSLGTIFFCYGLVGLILFSWVLLTVFRPAARAHQLYLVPPMLYGIANMGVRFSLFWVFLGLVFGVARYGRRTHDLMAARALSAREGSSHRRRRSRPSGSEQPAV
jgi:O-antigen ligase